MFVIMGQVSVVNTSPTPTDKGLENLLGAFWLLVYDMLNFLAYDPAI